VLVEDAHGAPPTVPFWRGEAPARTEELSSYVSDLREHISSLSLFPKEALQWLLSECGVDRPGAEQILNYIREGKSVLGTVPTKTRVIAERFFDESGGMQLILHAPFGARINKAWGLALRKRFCRSFNLELQASATDDGVNISLTEQHSFPLADVFRFLHSNSVERVVTQASLASPVFGTRWRWDAMRSLAVVRFRQGKKVPIQLLRMRSEDLLASVFPEAAACQDNVVGDIELPDHPLINETMKDVLQEAMDLDGLKNVLKQIESGAIECVAVDTPIPSPFSHEILNANPYAYLDDVPLEERRSRAVGMRRVLPESVVGEVGMLDPEAIADVVQQCVPDIRTSDELHDALLSFIALPARLNELAFHPGELWSSFFEELLKDQRVGVGRIEGKELWFAAERMNAFHAAYPQAEIVHRPMELSGENFEAEDAIHKIICGWMPVCGPVTCEVLADELRLPHPVVEQALFRMERSGSVLRGKFSRRTTDQIEWCDRRVLARIHRLTVSTLRKMIEPVTAAQFMRWVFRWQHAAPGTQLHGERGVLEVLQQLQGFEIPAREWEDQILARRISDYDPSMLDKLCWTGTVGWGRFSSPSSISVERKIPGKAAPITFFIREDCDWLHPFSDEPDLFTGEAALVLEALKKHGASFIPDLVRITKLHEREVEMGLWELVTLGLISSDGFDGLRVLLGEGKRSIGSNRAGSGRWSVLFSNDAHQKERNIEACCRMLLNRYGVVFRDVIQRETLIPRWRDLLWEFRKMEDRGQVRGGRFVSGFVGEQFALPLAVDSLRTIRRIEPSGEIVTLSAADPLNLIGIIVPGERIPAVARRPVVYRDGISDLV
jgi:ATP-dependent Lhr-like helicase